MTALSRAAAADDTLDVPPAAACPRNHKRWRPASLLTASLMLAATPAAAQPAAPGSATTSPAETAQDHPEGRNRIYLGMWTMHFKERPLSLKNNWLVGFSREPYFAGAFVNSFDNVALSAGLQRTLVRTRHRAVEFSFGGRLGIVTGYDGRFMEIARNSPVLPLIQAFSLVDIGHVGIEVSYTFVVASVATSVRF